jgi:hypothetical protein
LTSGLGVDGAADGLGVDRKTIERWIGGRVPYRRHQFALASLVGVDIGYLWPDARSQAEVTALGQAEVLTVYPHRSLVPRELWFDLFAKAEDHLDVLVYAAFWLSEDPAFRKLVAAKSEAGTAVRLTLGDPDCDQVAQRSIDEGIGSAITAKIYNTIVNYRELFGLPNVEFRLHSTVLYNSVYRADDHMLVNPHVYGASAYQAPILHLQRVPGADLFNTYLDSFEKVWSVAKPINHTDVSRAAS